MDRKNWTLLAIAAAEGESLSKVQLQKALFVLSRKLPGEIGEPFYLFEAYKYGPFAVAAYEDAEALATQGFVTISPASSPEGDKYVATPAGLERAQSVRREVSPKAGAYLHALVAWTRRLLFSEVVEAVYAEYPEMRENTKVRAAGKAKRAALPPTPDERARQLQAAFEALPGFMETLRAAQEDESAGRVLTGDQIRGKYQIQD